jgi:hypothetical protein
MAVRYFRRQARKSGTKRTLAMTNKTLRNSLIALAAFAIAATFVSASSFAAEFTVHHGMRYRAILVLKSVEQLANNALIAQKFRDLGFPECAFQVKEQLVESKGSGRVRIPALTCLLKS